MQTSSDQVMQVLWQSGFEIEAEKFPQVYHDLYIRHKFVPAEAEIVLVRIDQLFRGQPFYRMLAELMGAVLYFSTTQPHLWVEAILATEQTPFISMFTAIARPLEAMGVSDLYLKRGSVNAEYRTFEYEDLEFNLSIAEEILHSSPRDAILTDFSDYYRMMGTRIEVSPDWALRPETDLNQPIWAASLPQELNSCIVIDGYHRLLKASLQGSPYGDRLILPCILFSLAETEAFFMSEHLRPVFLRSLGRLQ